jgi:hypothetical protein
MLQALGEDTHNAQPGESCPNGLSTEAALS